MGIRFKKIFRIGGLISLIIILSGILVNTYYSFDSRNKDSSLEIQGVISDIKISDNHATASFLINDNWEYLYSYGNPIARRLGQEGDSISKIKGDNILRLYRKDTFGKYVLIEELDSY